jgi:hypothetical protein
MDDTLYDTTYCAKNQMGIAGNACAYSGTFVLGLKHTHEYAILMRPAMQEGRILTREASDHLRKKVGQQS